MNDAAPRPQHISFVIDAILPFHAGGREKRLYEISKRLVAAGHEVHIYTMQWWTGNKHLELDGVHYHAIAKLQPLYKGDRRSIKQAVWFGFAAWKLLGQKLETVDVDHMPYFPLFTMRMVCWLRRKKLIGTWHEVWGKTYWQTYLGRLGRVGYWLEKLSWHLPDTILSNSNHTTVKLIEQGVPAAKIVTIMPGVDLSAISQVPKHSMSSDVIYVGRLLEHKNVDVLVRAIQHVAQTLPQVSGLIVGSGPERDRLLTLIEALGLQPNLRLIDTVATNQELYSYMKAAKVLVLPSIREGFGLIALEALACGIPVITTDHPDNAARDFIKEGQNGYTVLLDEQLLAHRITKVLTQDKFSVEQITESMKAFTWDHVVGQLEQEFAR